MVDEVAELVWVLTNVKQVIASQNGRVNDERPRVWDTLALRVSNAIKDVRQPGGGIAQKNFSRNLEEAIEHLSEEDEGRVTFRTV